MGNEFSSQASKRKWRKVNGVYDIIGRRLQIQKQIDKLNIQFDELTDEINREKVNLQGNNTNNTNNTDNLQGRNTYNNVDNIDNRNTTDNISNVAIKDGNVGKETMRDDTLLHNSLLYSPTLSRIE